MNILILGANGFIGSHLSEAILANKQWHVFAMDLRKDKLYRCLEHPRFHFTQGDITTEQEWISQHIQLADVILPLVAIATPATYVQDPLRVFALDFEANLAIIRECVKYNKRLIFPSTSEVYGMCQDSEFDEDTSVLVTGPINKERWIYSTSKQLLDRLIYAYGKQGLSYTLFRPFNWYGPRLDDIFNPKPGGSRVLTQFIGNILRGEAITLVNGGSQKRCFTFIDDGIAALMKMIENKNDQASNAIFNVGNPQENISIKGLAETLISMIKNNYPTYAKKAEQVKLIPMDAAAYYGEGYQDVDLRVPSIRHAQEKLAWVPKVGLQEGLKQTLSYYLSPSSSKAAESEVQRAVELHYSIG